MIALKRYIINLFEEFEIDNAVENELLLDISNIFDIYESGCIGFYLEDNFISGDIPVLFADMDRAIKDFAEHKIEIKETHSHNEYLHFHFELSLTKENIDKIYFTFFNLSGVIN
jgi:hypothetical protein